MDPNATLADLIDAACNGECDRLEEAAENLLAWLHKDGFLPTWQDVARIASASLA